MPSTKIAQMVPLCWTKGPPELQIRTIFKNIYSWTTGQNFILLHMYIPHDALFQNCINGYPPPPPPTEQEGRQVRNLLNDIWTTGPNSKPIHRIVPHNATYQNCTNGSPPFNKRGTRAPDKKYLLNHWSKFKSFHRIVLHDTLYQNCTNGSTPLKKRAVRAPDKKYL